MGKQGQGYRKKKWIGQRDVFRQRGVGEGFKEAGVFGRKQKLSKADIEGLTAVVHDMGQDGDMPSIEDTI